MKPSDALERHRDLIRRLAQAHGALNPRVFGSTARGEDCEGSDLDVLVDVVAGTTLFELGALYEALNKALGVGVDLVTVGELRPEYRAQVLAEARPI